MLTQAIANLGFPIAVCAVCFWYINRQEERHTKDIEKMTMAIDNNTHALEKLIYKIGGENNESI